MLEGTLEAYAGSVAAVSEANSETTGGAASWLELAMPRRAYCGT